MLPSRPAKYSPAAEYFRQEGAVYDKLGDHNAATVEHVKSQEYAIAGPGPFFAEVKPNAAGAGSELYRRQIRALLRLLPWRICLEQ